MVETVLAEIVRRKRHDVRVRLDGLSLDAEPTKNSLRATLDSLVELNRSSLRLDPKLTGKFGT